MFEALGIRNTDARFGMIVSNKFLRANYGKPLRDYLNKEATVELIIDFAGLPVFKGATVRTVVLITTPKRQGEAQSFYSPPLSASEFSAVESGTITVDQAIKDITFEVAPEAFEHPSWSFGKLEDAELLSRLKENSMPLSQYCEGRIFMGIKSGLTYAFVIDEQIRAAILEADQNSEEIIKPFLNGRNVRRYSIDYKNLFLIYTHHGVDIRRYPAIEQHLKPYKERLQARATKQAWYELQQPQFKFSGYMDGTKIVFPDIATSPRFALDEMGYYSSNTTYFIPRRDLYLLGILNSNFGRFFFERTCAGLEGKNEIYLRFFGQYLELFPVHSIDLADKGDKDRHDKMVALVDQMLSLNKQLASAKTDHEKTALQRQIDAIDKQIDKLVYELYGLTEEEIRIVDGKG